MAGSDNSAVEAAVKRPTSYEELGAAIRAAGETGTQVRLAGSDSMPLTRFGDDRPVRTISTLRLNKLIEHAAADMTVIVQAGMTLEALQKQLAWHKQWLPVDPPAMGRTPGTRTIGGLIASNSLGPLRLGFGDWRLLIMGMRWVDAGGTLITGGGRTVKNVAGYSTPRMMIGSCGSLGAIAEVTLRTLARPEDEQCVVFFCDSAARAEDLLGAIMQSDTTPTYLEAVGGRTFGVNPLGLPAGAASGIVLLVGFTGRPEVCAGQVDVARGLPAARGVEAIAQTAAQAGRLRLWLTSEPAPDSGTAGFRIHGLSSAACALVGALEADIFKGGGTAWIASEAGTGVVRGQARCATARQIVVACARDVRVAWSYGVETGAKGDDPIRGRIKAQLDPGGLFGDAP